MTSELPDVQQEASSYDIKIDWAGISKYRCPFKISQKNGKVQYVVGEIEIYSDVLSKDKGVHMSRFSQIIEDSVQKDSLAVNALEKMLVLTKEKLKSKNSRATIRFPYFITKKAPVSKIKSYFVIDCSFCGILKGESISLFLEINTTYTSLCPCSRAMSLTNKETGVGRGAHSQKGNARVRVQFKNLQDFIWIEDLNKIVENSSSCEIYNSLKRPDEKYVTEKAYNNPMFVEDVSRKIASQLNELKEIDWYQIEVEHFESIHQSNAVARIEKNI